MNTVPKFNRSNKKEEIWSMEFRIEGLSKLVDIQENRKFLEVKKCLAT
jgi:hypothetical protein